MTRYAGPARISLSRPSDSALIDTGRKLAGGLVARGEPVGAARRQLADGSTVEAVKIGGQHAIRIESPPVDSGAGVRMEEIIHLYISSPGGLRVVDLGTKKLVQTVTGLDPYEVDGVSLDGGVVWMSGEGIGVRADVRALSAFGYSYLVDAVTASNDHVSGYANVQAGLPSPDGSRVLWAFGLTRDGSGSAIDGLTGFLLADGDTLEPVRPAIRMGFRVQSAAWSGDGQRFFLAASLAADSNGVATPTVATSMADYVAMFDRDGMLLSTLQLGTWGFAPSTGFARLVRSVSAWGDRVFALAETGWNSDLRLFAIAVDGTTMAVTGSTPVPDPGSARMIHALRGNRVAVVRSNNSMDLYTVATDPPELLGTASGVAFDTSAATNPLGSSYWANGVVRSGPDSRVGQPPDRRRFFLNGASGMVSGYRDFAKPPVYTLDLSAYAPRNRYRLAAVGARQVPRSPA